MSAVKKLLLAHVAVDNPLVRDSCGYLAHLGSAIKCFVRLFKDGWSCAAGLKSRRVHGLVVVVDDARRALSCVLLWCWAVCGWACGSWVCLLTACGHRMFGGLCVCGCEIMGVACVSLTHCGVGMLWCMSMADRRCHAPVHRQSEWTRCGGEGAAGWRCCHQPSHGTCVR